MAELQRRAEVRIPSRELLLADNSQNNTSCTNRGREGCSVELLYHPDTVFFTLHTYIYDSLSCNLRIGGIIFHFTDSISSLTFDPFQIVFMIRGIIMK